MAHVAGYSLSLDMTLRGPEFQCFRKSIDSYAVLGPWLVTADEVPDPGQLDLWLHVNGQTRQQANTRDLIFDVPRLIEFASSFYTLQPGDVIMTGTPEGVGPVVPGDWMEAGVQGLGTLSMRVASKYA
jgi:2-keto-4-pentenoate hydratase/2-oxohepta-3-ene-1,7-dioic acid hydratase in catechol pathway